MFELSSAKLPPPVALCLRRHELKLLFMGSNDSSMVSPMTPMESVPSKMSDFYIGLALAVSSSLFIGSSFIIKKKALIKLANGDVSQRASEGGYGYLREWMWWMGVITIFILYVVSVILVTLFIVIYVAPRYGRSNIIVYISVCSLIGSLSVLSVKGLGLAIKETLSGNQQLTNLLTYFWLGAVLSSRLLKERLNLLGKIGCAVCLLGSTVIVIHSPKEEEVASMADLALKMKDAVFILYVVSVILVTLFIVIYVAPRYGRSNIIVYISVCSLIGSLSVLSVKGLGLAIKETLSGNQQLTNLLTYFWLGSVAACVSVQLVYLNKALDMFNTSMVTPIYYVFFTTFVILASSILYKVRCLICVLLIL
ncbi:hypothetical protein ANCCEY_12549 [Ancylostoma ceylanicum]|uniref:Magnesium transporter NIPA2 n=1 Tax=Ancylostoma ceylanicum TaxID=53326 RepID=A0A0D6LAX3_9BILA|nr:hypothetical protein ANCCEY_12549 [Ancylostoma ceylanicum]